MRGKRRRWYGTIAFALVLAANSLGAQEGEPWRSYRPDAQLSGTIKIWGNDRMQSVLMELEQAFRKQQPEIRFQNHLMGTGTAMAGLYTGVADLAFMGRPATPKELMGFEWVFQYKPTTIEVMTGSFSTPGKSPALAVFVHKDNPLAKLTLAQLDAIFSCERRRGLNEIDTWGRLGLSGEWSNKKIHAYGFDAETGTGAFFRQVVLEDSRKWKWPHTREFKDIPHPDGSVTEASQQIVDALSQDRYGIAVATFAGESSRVKALALANASPGPFYRPTRESLIQRTYPLTRSVWVYLNRSPGNMAESNVRAFLRFVLSPEGQKLVSRDNGFLPLSTALAIKEVKQLN